MTMRTLLMGLAIALTLGAAPSRAQQGGGSESVPPAALEYQGSRADSVNQQRQIESERPSVEQRERETETRLLDAERQAREHRSNVDSRLTRERRSIVRRNESAADREMRLRNLENEARRIDAERWQAEDLERKLRSEYTSMGRSAGRPGGLW